METSSYKENVTKQWWYLWNKYPCCLKNSESGKDHESLDKSLETRNKILLAAFNEIYQKGFQAASISNILKDTGITKGALYHHFENKQELGYTVLEEIIAGTIRRTWVEPLKNTDDPITVLKQILIESGAVMTEEDVCLGCPLNNLAQEMSPIDEGFKIRITNIYQEWQDAIESACDRGKLAGNFANSIDSREISMLFIASLQGCMGYAKSIQKLDILMACGKGLIDRLDSVRPSIRNTQ